MQNTLLTGSLEYQFNFNKKITILLRKGIIQFLSNQNNFAIKY